MKQLNLFASCSIGLEELLAAELMGIGAVAPTATRAGVRFTGTIESAYRCCLYSRLASRVMLHIATVNASDTEQLRARVLDLAWEQYLAAGMTLAVDFIGRSQTIRNSLFGAQCVKDGVVDRVRAVRGDRPNVDRHSPDLRIVARLKRDRLSLALDLAGAPLHRRGIRRPQIQAPLKETLAAAILLRAGWPDIAAQGGGLYDPVCGSGTLLLEAALMAGDAAPGLTRRFAFQNWPGFDQALWNRMIEEASARAEAGRLKIPPIAGADWDPRVVEQTKSAVRGLALDDKILLDVASVNKQKRPVELHTDVGLFIANPPYGERIGEKSRLTQLYRELGQLWRDEFTSWRAALFSSDRDLLRAAGIRSDKVYRLRNGRIECRLVVADPRARSDKLCRAEPTGAEMPALAAALIHRIRKNRKRLKAWLKRTGTNCYRIYDADIPQYALAVDVYGDWAQVSEYVAPPEISRCVAAERFESARRSLPEALDLPSARILYKRRQRQRGESQYQRLSRAEEEISVFEAPAKFRVNLRDYLDTGLFLDHRPMRRLIAELSPGRRFLNLFCYTAAATVHAALGRAEESLSIDLSARHLAWAKRNFSLNGLDLARHRLLQADCLTWLKNCKQRYGLIFLDPPTFSNSKRMSTSLDVQRDHVGLIQAAARLLEPGGILLFSCSRRRFKLDYAALSALDIRDFSDASWDPDFAHTRVRHHCFRFTRPG